MVQDVETKRPTSPRAGLLTGADVPSTVRNVVERSCQDCHSANTRWPWYANIPPISWQIHGDVARARRFLDLGNWDDYSHAEKAGFLASIDAAVTAHLMPPNRYLLMHPQARLSSMDLRALSDWTNKERQRLRSVP